MCRLRVSGCSSSTGDDAEVAPLDQLAVDGRQAERLAVERAGSRRGRTTWISTWSNTHTILPARDPRERHHPHARPVAADAARARDRGRADRRRRRRPRDRAREPGARRPRRPLSSCPGFSDSHVHFPTWALAQHEVRLDGCALARRGARARPRGAGARPGRLAARLRLAERRLVAAAEPTRHDLDALTGDMPAGADREGLPLAVAQLGRARAGERRPRGRRAASSSATSAASRPASCARSRRGASRSGT